MPTENSVLIRNKTGKSREWLTQNWLDPQVGAMVIESMKTAVKTSSTSHLPDMVKKLWKANCHSVEILELVDNNWGGSNTRYKQEGRAYNNIKHIRTCLPEDISLYNLGREGRLVLMPTVPNDEFVLLPEDQEIIFNLQVPKEILPFAAWINFRQVENNLGVKGTTLSSRGNKKAIDLLNYLLQNYGKGLTKKNIAKHFDWKEEKDVDHYARIAREISLHYLDPNGTILTVELDGEKYYITEGSEEDRESLEKIALALPSPIDYPEVKNLISAKFALDQFKPINPIEANGDATIKPEDRAVITWKDILLQLNISELECLKVFEQFKSLGIDLDSLPNNIAGILKKIHLNISAAENLFRPDTPLVDDAITALLNDVNTSVLIAINSDQGNEELTETPEDIWKDFQNQRYHALKLNLIEEYLKNMDNDENPVAAERVGDWLAKIDQIRANKPELSIPFYSSSKTIANVKNEVARLHKLRQISRWFRNYEPLRYPRDFLVGKKTKKKEKPHEEIRKAFESLNDVEEALDITLAVPPIAELLNQYLNSYIYYAKRALSTGRVRTYQGYFSVADQGNMEFVEYEAIDLGGKNLIPIRVFNSRYRIVPGDMKLLTDNQTQVPILDTEGLPIIYFDSSIVFNNDAYRGSPVKILTL